MTALPWREPLACTSQQRAERASRLRQILGPVEGWAEDWQIERIERLGLLGLEEGAAQVSTEVEVTDALRAELLGRLS